MEPKPEGKNTLSRRAIIRAMGTAAGAVALSSIPLSAFADDGEYTEDEIGNAVEDFFGVTAQAAATVVEKVFSDLGRPNAYVKGEEASAALVVGARYGEGYLHRKGHDRLKIYWQGPSVGFDVGANASKCFTLVYNLRRQSEIFQRFPGVEGSYYFIAGIGVNYLRSGRISLAPMRTGVGVRAGVNAGYLHFTEDEEWLPF